MVIYFVLPKYHWGQIAFTSLCWFKDGKFFIQEVWVGLFTLLPICVCVCLLVVHV